MTPVIDLRDPALREEWQLSLGFMDTVPIPPRRRKSVQEHRGRGETEAMIVDALRSANRPLTRLEIARLIQRAKSPWLIALIEALVSNGKIIAVESEYRGFQCWTYVVAPLSSNSNYGEVCR